MRNFRNLIIGFVAVALIGGIVLAQTSQYGSRGTVFNASTVTVNKNKVMKWDTTFKRLMVLDTTYYVWMQDTVGKSTGRGGSLGLAGKFPDSLNFTAGGAFDLKFIPISAPSTDSVIIHGWKVMDIYSRADSVAIKDTVILAAGGKVSKHLWSKLDSIFMTGFANAGTDCVKIMYHQPLRALVADTLATNIAGVLGDSVAYYGVQGKSQHILANTYGQVIISGDVRVYASGKNDVIRIGDELMVGNNGKVVKANQLFGFSDTLKITASVETRYLKGAKKDDVVLINKRRRFDSAAAGDTITYVGSISIFGDTLIIRGLGQNGTYTPAAKTDSLAYTWIPRNLNNEARSIITGFDSRYVIGRSLQYCETDSTRIWMRLINR